MRSAPNSRWWGLAFFAVPACAQVLALDEFAALDELGEPAPGCETVEDCAAEVPLCFEATCDDGSCGRIASTRGAECDDGRACDGAGQCLTALGEKCDAASECLTPSCVDGVCCDAPSCDACSQCGGSGCEPRAAGSKPDDCSGACDGDGGCAVGGLSYGKIFGAAGDQLFFDLALLPDGGAAAVGIYYGALTLAGKPLLEDAAGNVLVVKLDKDGEVEWAFGGGNPVLDDRAHGVAVASDGTIAVVGTTTVNGLPSGFLRTFAPDGGMTTDAVGLAGVRDAYDVACVGEDVLVSGSTSLGLPFVTRYTRAGVAVKTAALVTDITTNGNVRRLKLASDGGVLLAGSVRGFLAIGDNMNATDQDAFVAKLDADLTGQWLVPIASTSADAAIDVAEASNGDVVVGGQYAGDVPAPFNLKAGTFPSGFIVRLSPKQQVSHAVGFAGTGTSWVHGVDVDAHGNMIALGYFNGEVPVGGTTLKASDPPSGGPPYDGFVAKSSASPIPLEDAPLWSHAFGTAGIDYVYGLAVEPDSLAVRFVGTASTAAAIAGVSFTGTDPDRGALIARLAP